MNNSLKIIKKIAIIILVTLSVLIIGFLLAELINYFLVINTDGYYVWPPDTKRTFYPRQDVTHGIEGISKFTINDMGYRGPVLTNKQEEYRILAIGGSATICNYLDDYETWPYLLNKLLKKTSDAREVIVLNVGKSGHTTTEHLYQIEHLTDQYQPDLVVMLIGVNDMLLDNIMKRDDSRLLSPGHEKAFFYSPRYSIRSSILFRSLRYIYIMFILKNSPEHPAGLHYIEKRLKRKNCNELTDIPFFEDSLYKYESNLNEIMRISRQKRVKLLLLTQPSMWKENMSPIEEGNLWMTIDLKGNSYSSKTMAYLMKAYNQKLLEICSRHQDIYCFDLDSEIPKDMSHFYDDVHFNEGGAKKVAKQTAIFIRDKIELFNTK
jgi:lysophospholipase L1-like esterase